MGRLVGGVEIIVVVVSCHLVRQGRELLLHQDLGVDHHQLGW